MQALPIIAAEAAHVTVFQRTPSFSIPAWNGPLSDEADRERKARYAEFRELERAHARRQPVVRPRRRRSLEATPEERAQELEARYRVGGFFLHSAYSDRSTTRAPTSSWPTSCATRSASASHDPETAELLCPYDYPFATKRMCIDTDYFEAYNRPNVASCRCARRRSTEFTERGLRIGDEEFAFDVLVFASGFDAMTGAVLGVDIRGRGGRTVQEKWERRAAHRTSA